jgi:hypothetical protein
MSSSLKPAEAGLLAAAASALALACLGPAVPQFEHYHAFADQRALGGLAHAADVLSNLPFAVLGVWGLVRLRLGGAGQPLGAQRVLAALFFAGLVLTALCSGTYHLHPDNAGLALDRLGMVGPFAGLLGLAAAERVSARAGLWTAAAVAALGPLAVQVWSASGNLLPWSVLQGGGMLLIVALALRRPVAGAWGLSLGAVVGWYVLAKALELGDHAVFDASGGWVSGHTLKHVAAALAAWPLMHNGGRARSHPQHAAWA